MVPNLVSTTVGLVYAGPVCNPSSGSEQGLRSLPAVQVTVQALELRKRPVLATCTVGISRAIIT